MAEPRIYLDYAASAPLRPEVSARLAGLLALRPGNPSSIHGAGREARQLIEEARRQVAALLSARPEEILFTSGGTEANNLALRGICGAGLRRLITTAGEHLSILETAAALSAEGVEVVRLPLDGAGMPSLEALSEALSAGPALLSLAWVNNETGNLLPLRRAAKLVKRAGGLLHVDAVQAAAYLPLDVSEAGIDLLSLSAHKLGALPGTGALYLRRGLSLRAEISGGRQERGLRGGTENLFGIVAFGEACRLALAEREEAAARVSALRERLVSGLRGAIPGARENGDPARRAPHIANLLFPGCEGQLILIHLDLEGICASSGSACATGQLSPSHVLLAMGHSPEAAQSAVRFSLGRETTAEEIERVIAVMPGIVERVRG